MPKSFLQRLSLLACLLAGLALLGAAPAPALAAPGVAFAAVVRADNFEFRPLDMINYKRVLLANDR